MNSMTRPEVKVIRDRSGTATNGDPTASLDAGSGPHFKPIDHLIGYLVAMRQSGSLNYAQMRRILDYVDDIRDDVIRVGAHIDIDRLAQSLAEANEERYRGTGWHDFQPEPDFAADVIRRYSKERGNGRRIL